VGAQRNPRKNTLGRGPLERGKFDKNMARVHTHYDNLKVPRHASTEVIRAAYRTLLRKYHPDRNPGDSEAARIMRIINSSYAILADPIKRNKHDIWISAQEQTHPSVGPTEVNGSKAATSPAPVGFKEKLIRGIRKLTFHMAPW
jgi:DnaJ-class molecular chaperone